MPTSVFYDGAWWDVHVTRDFQGPLGPVWLKHQGERKLLCQIAQSGRFGWSVVVAGPVRGVRLVDGFKTRWQAVKYAIGIRTDINPRDEE